MGVLSTLAQYSYDDSYYYSSPSYSSGDASLAAGVVLVMFLIWFVVFVGVYVVTALCLMKIFKKAGVKDAWAAWVPFYNSWKLLEIGGQQGFWAVLAIIPVVNIASAIFMYIAMYHIGKKLGKSDTFVLWAIFLPVVWLIWLAVDQSTWNDANSSAPSLDPGARGGGDQTPPAAPTAGPTPPTPPVVPPTV